MKYLAKLSIIFFLFTSSLYAQKDVSITIIQTSDVHGFLFPFDYINNTAVDHGMAHVLSYVNKIRQDESNEVILLDNGDILQGQPTVYYANFVDTIGEHLVSKVMNYMKYDAGSIGNHDIEAGPKVYNKLVNDFKFPWLSANIIDKRTGSTYFKPYTIINRKGVKIAVLGLTTPGVPNWLSPNLWENMEFIDMVDAAKMWIDSIKINEDPHVIVGLFHSGLNAEYEGANPNKPLNENASLLVAEKVPGFDVVLVGHDHDRVVKTIKNSAGESVLILDPGSRAHLVSDVRINLTFDDQDNLINKQVSGELVPMKGLMPDPDYVSNFSGFNREVEEFVDRKIGYISASVSTRDAYFGPSPFINLLHSAQLGISNSDISFAAPLSFDATIEQGNVYMRDMFKLYSYENLLYIMSLTGQEIKDYLEYSYGLWFNTMANENDNLLLFREDETGEVLLHNRERAIFKSSYYNFDSASGINYEVDVSKPKGDRINILSMADGSPFSLDKTYKIAINSYRGTGGGSHLVEGVGIPKEDLKDRVVSISSHDMRHYLMKWIEREGKLNPDSSKNWKLIPEEWVNAAKSRDLILLFGEE